MNPLRTTLRRRISAALIAASLGLVVTACSDSQSAVPAKTPEVGVVTLSTTPLTLESELAGRTSAFMVAQIRPQVGGILNKRAFTEGAQVRAGELLYQIDPASYQAAYASAQASVARSAATVDASRLKAKRQSDLLAIEAISKQDNEDAQVALQQAQADLASAQAALDTARINLDHTRITSPIGGRVETSTVTAGALLTANQETALTTVQQLDPIYVDVPQSSAEVLALRKDLASGRLTAGEATATRIQVILEDGSVYAHEGRLQFSGVTVNTTTGAVTLRALVPNPEHLLLPGMYVHARVAKGSDPAALLVPQSGIGRDNAGRPTALVVTAENKVELRNVSVAEAVGSNWRVTDGLAAGDRVIVEGSGKVKPGQSVVAVAAGQKPAGKADAAGQPATAASVVKTAAAR